jgi:3-keto-disaccharide hydrolase
MSFRSRVAAGAGIAAIFGLLMTGPAFAACNADNSIYEDDFEFLDPSWGEADEHSYVEDGAFVVNAYSRVNFQTTTDVADVCVDVTIAQAPEPDSNPAGIVFWWQDWDNYYVLLIWPSGGTEVGRYVKGKYVTVVSPETLAVKKGVGETNAVELQLRAKDATVIINGTEVTRFKGRPPKDGSPIGFESYGDDTLVKFDNLVVASPSE